MPLASGTRLGPYEITSPLGAGGMGEVYRARDTRLDRAVAIKVLAAHLASSPEIRDRFEREARTSSQLSHPHICALYDVGTAPNPAPTSDVIQFLVMELLEGDTLAIRLAKGPLPFEQTRRYGIEIAAALETAHRRGIIHRDLKPGNVMLTPSGVKLLDFGLAKAIEPLAARGSASVMATEMTPADLTGPGGFLGTLQYMSPEQVEGKPADARADIFALGAMLYEMATGSKAFVAPTPARLATAILTGTGVAAGVIAVRGLVRPPEPPAEDEGPDPVTWGRRGVALAGVVFGLVLWHVEGVVTGDALFHEARVRKLVELSHLHLRSVDELVHGGLHPGYAFPLWHGFLALVTKVSGLDPSVVLHREASVLVPIAFVVAWEAGYAVFNSVTGGVSVLAASVALYCLAAGHGGAYVSLALPATASRQILVLAAFALFFTYAESGRIADLAALSAAFGAIVIVHPTYALFALTAGKVVFWDLQTFSIPYRMLSFLALALLLTAGAYLNLRFRERLMRREAA
jgi:hypothetical protein